MQWGCDGPSYGAGDLCSCTGGDECYLDCEDDGCRQHCGQARICGGVCTANNCDITCDNVTDCSAYCEEDCHVDCHNVSSCGGICGRGCLYECEGVDRCGVEVGAESTVRCGGVSSCVVVCSGTCEVFVSGVGSFDVECADGTTRRDQDGRVVCE
jgi:hypothetical protein